MTDKLYVVGLTGPTGAGKSEVARVWKAEHIPVIDADVLARRVVEPGQPALAALAAAFPADILHENGTLNRQRLAHYAFATPQDTQKLNAITHPYIVELTRSILSQFQQMRERLAVIEAPLLFETGLDAVCDSTVAVMAAADVRRDRIRLRDNLTEEQANARMAAQQEDAYYTSRATVTLHSNGNLEDLRRQAAELAGTIREWAI